MHREITGMRLNDGSMWGQSNISAGTVDSNRIVHFGQDLRDYLCNLESIVLSQQATINKQQKMLNELYYPMRNDL